MTNLPPELRAQVAFLESEAGAEISFAFHDFQTGATKGYNADRKVKTASVIKLPILVHAALAVQEGAHSWNDSLTLTDAEKVGGSGVLTHLSHGLSLTLRDVCVLMTIVSDNTATNMVIEHTGVEVVNARMRALGLPITTLFRKSYSQTPPVSEDNARYGLGMTTPNEMLRLIIGLAEGRIGNADISADILRILAEQQYRDAIPRLLPPDWTYAGKTGSLDHVRNDVGLVTARDGRRFAFALFCQELPAVLWTVDNPGLLALARLTAILIQ